MGASFMGVTFGEWVLVFPRRFDVGKHLSLVRTASRKP